MYVRSPRSDSSGSFVCAVIVEGPAWLELIAEEFCGDVADGHFDCGASELQIGATGAVESSFNQVNINCPITRIL